MHHHERHRIHRSGWLRAAVLGANDGIVSTASLVVGVAATQASHNDVLVAGIAGLVAGAMSMAAGEYVSVSSQADIEASDLARESKELESDSAAEHKELADIYIARGVDPTLAQAVATQLMHHDALGAHARDELGILEMTSARPLQAAWASAAAFSMGAFLPLLVAYLSNIEDLIPAVGLTSLIFLAILGLLSARTGGGSMRRAALRITFWGALAMGLTASVGHLFNVMV